MYVRVCAKQFSISPWATPTHSHVNCSVSERDPVKQRNLFPNLYDCSLAVFKFFLIICLLQTASQAAVMFVLKGMVF